MNLTRLILHKFDPEWIHNVAIDAGQKLGGFDSVLNLVSRLYGFEDARLSVTIGNLTFPNPIGLAAGFDKDGKIVPLLQALGFGFIEVGTVTPLPQPGNPKPRLFRLVKDEAVINRMGFNNLGVDALVNSLKAVRKQVPIGVNLGKNKTTPMNRAVDDYIVGLNKAWQVADYFTINISSPNTENLRDLQSADQLQPLIESIVRQRNLLSDQTGRYRQVWLKIAPDLTDKAINAICDVVSNSGIDALVVTNTTIDKSRLASSWQEQEGGVSGKPLYHKSNAILNLINQRLQGNITLIGVGGIFSADDVQRKLSLGASLVQVYTSFVFQGPGSVKQLKKDLVKGLEN